MEVVRGFLPRSPSTKCTAWCSQARFTRLKHGGKRLDQNPKPSIHVLLEPKEIHLERRKKTRCGICAPMWDLFFRVLRVFGLSNPRTFPPLAVSPCCTPFPCCFASRHMHLPKQCTRTPRSGGVLFSTGQAPVSRDKPSHP